MSSQRSGAAGRPSDHTRSETVRNENSRLILFGLAALLRILEVLGSDLGQETNYTDWKFRIFSSVSPGDRLDHTSNYALTASNFMFYNLLFSNHPTIRRFIIIIYHYILKNFERHELHQE